MGAIHPRPVHWRWRRIPFQAMGWRKQEKGWPNPRWKNLGSVSKIDRVENQCHEIASGDRYILKQRFSDYSKRCVGIAIRRFSRQGHNKKVADEQHC
jgi:hypothetical protein